ncbi:MAG: glycosyltransferase, partial [Colwellia sp.]
ISIVTISFNQCKFLKQCMNSVLSQRESLAKIGVELEYIVVDPGSTDGSRELIASYGDEVIKVFEKDKGPADGLNNGFALATGDIFGYLNSDDVFTDDALAFACASFKEAKGEFDVLNGASNLVGPSGEIHRVLYSDVYSPIAFAYSGCILIQPSSFFTKDAFCKTNKFNVSNRTNWDGELFVDMGLAGAKFETTKKILSGYRVHDESITGTMSTANMMQSYRAEMYERITGNSMSSYCNLVAIYFKYRRKLVNYRDTVQRVFGGKSFGRAVK